MDSRMTRIYSYTEDDTLGCRGSADGVGIFSRNELMLPNFRRLILCQPSYVRVTHQTHVFSPAWQDAFRRGYVWHLVFRLLFYVSTTHPFYSF
jgi:hypothetical protein